MHNELLQVRERMSGNRFSNFADLEKANRSGKAHIRVSERCCLPTVYQSTGDAKWNEGGEF